MHPFGELLVGLAVLVGVVGLVVPVLPGALLVWVAVLVWAIETQTQLGWLVLTAATVFIVLSQVVKWTVPEKRLRLAGVPRRSIVVAGLLGVVGFFVIPVVGLFLGFALGIYLTERRRHTGQQQAHDQAWAATITTIRLSGLSILIELTGALLAAGTWLVAVVVT